MGREIAGGPAQPIILIDSTGLPVTIPTQVTLPAFYKTFNTATLSVPNVTTGGASWTTAHSPVTLFTVTGSVWLRVYGVVGATALTSTGGLGTLSIGISGTVGLYLPLSTVSGAAGQFAIGSVWVGATPTLLSAVPLLANLTWAINNGANVILTVATADMTAGAMTIYADWMPISSGATVV